MSSTLRPPQAPPSFPQRVLFFGQVPSAEATAALTRALGEAGLEVDARSPGSPTELAGALGEQAGQVILAYLADEAALRELATLSRRHDPRAPIVVVVAGAGPLRAGAWLRAGAHDAVLEADAEHLAAVIEREAAAAEAARQAEVGAERAARLEHLIENIPVMLFSKEAVTLKVDLWNRAAEELSGVPRHLMLGKTAWDLFPNEAALYDQADREVIADKIPVAAEEPITTPRGERWVLTTKVPVLDARGKVVTLLCTSVDITERRAAEHAGALANRKLTSSEEEKSELIVRLRQAIDEVSNPILEVWDDVLVMPVIGLVSTARAVDMAQRLLVEVDRSQASFVIVDLTGVEALDARTAEYLIRLTRKVELLGARCVLTGIGPAVAEALVDMGTDFGHLTTLRNLKHGLREALRVTRQKSRLLRDFDLDLDLDRDRDDKARPDAE